MKRRLRKVFSAMTAAAVCAVNVPVLTANSGIVTEPGSTGVDKGYYYEYQNNDKDSKTTMLIETAGNIICSWDNDENMTASRGLKFAAPVRYEELGDISWKYWKRFDVDGFTDNRGYLRYGIRIRNSEGKTFDIMEIDTAANGKSITEKDTGYKKIGTLESSETLNDQTIFGPVKGDIYDVQYTLYSYDGEDGPEVLCRRNEPMTVNNYNEDSRRISLSDKLDAIKKAGYDIGEITDITNFFDVSYSKGEAHIYIDDVNIENMPEIAPDEYDDSSVVIKNYDYGERDGYYYYSSNSFEGQTEIIKPSLFKAEWDSTENKYNRDPVIERGKTFEHGQSYKALSGSSVDYAMKFDADGKFWAGSRATLSSISTDEYNSQVDIYIVDACKNWTVSGNAAEVYASSEKVGEIKAGGNTYDVYYHETGIEGSFKAIKMKEYYFVNRDAEKNGENGKVSAKYSLEPFVELIHDRGEILGAPSSLVVMLNGGVAKGSAELTENTVTLPEFIKDDGEFSNETRKIKLTGSDKSKTVEGCTYSVSGYDPVMEGYAGDKLTCTWKKDTSSENIQYPAKSSSAFSVYKGGLGSFLNSGGNDQASFSGFGGFGGAAGGAVQNTSQNNNLGIIDYSVDLMELTDEDEESEFAIGGSFTCNNNNFSEESLIRSKVSEEAYRSYTIVIFDKWEIAPGKEQLLSGFGFDEPAEFGIIETKGGKYDVKVYYPESVTWVSPYIILTRSESLKAEKAGDAECYENKIDGREIISKLNAHGLNLGNIDSAAFEIKATGNSGKAVINSISLEETQNDNKDGFTVEDVRKLTDFLHGKKTDIPTGTDYDLNDDGIWDVFDLCLMKKEVK